MQSLESRAEANFSPGVEATKQHQAFCTQDQNLWIFSEIIKYKLGQTYQGVLYLRM